MSGYVPEQGQVSTSAIPSLPSPFSAEQTPESFYIESPQKKPEVAPTEYQTRTEEYGKWKAGEATEVPEFAFTIHAATRGMSDQDRTSYLQSFRDRMSERVQRYEWRKAKGVDLTKEQETVYKELLSKLQALNQMMETPAVYTQYMEGAGAQIGQELGVDYGSPIRTAPGT